VSTVGTEPEQGEPRKADPRPGGSVLKRWLVRLALCLGALAVLVVAVTIGALVLLHSEFGQRWLQARVNEALNGRIAWHALRLSPTEARLSIEQLRLEGPGGEALAGFDRFEVGWSWRRLAAGELFLSGSLWEPWAHLIRRGDGRLNLAEAFPAPTEEAADPAPLPPFNVVLDAFELRGGSVRYLDPAQGHASEMHGIRLTAAGDLARRSARLTLSADAGRLETPQLRTDLDILRFNAALGDGRITPLTLELGVGGTHLTLEGEILDPFAAPHLNVALALHASLEGLGRMLASDLDLSGDVTASLALKGPLQDPEVKLALDYGGGRLYGQPVERADLALRLADRQVRIEPFRIVSGEGTLQVQGEVDLRAVFPGGWFDPHPDFGAIAYDFFLQQDRLDLAALPVAADWAGEVDLRLDISGRGLAPSRINATTSLELDGRRVTADPAVAPLSVRLRGEAGIEEGRCRVKRFTADAGELALEASGEFDLNGEMLTADVRLDAPSLPGVLAPLGVSGASGSARLKATVSGPWRRPAFDLQLEASRLGWASYRLGDIRINATLDDSGKLRFAEVSLQNQGSRLNGSGNLQLFEKGLRLQSDPSLRFDLQLTDIEAKDFVGREIARGTLAGEVALEGTLNAPRGRLQLSATGLGVADLSLGELTAAMRFAEGLLYLDQLTLTDGSSRLSLNGSARLLERAGLALLAKPSLDVTLEAENLALERYLDQYAGLFSFEAHLEGDIRHPGGLLRVRGRQVTTPWQELAAVEFDGLLEGDHLQVERLALSPGEGQWLTARARLSREGFSDFTMTCDGISLGDIDLISEQMPLEGLLGCDLQGEGPFVDPNLSGRLRLSEVRIAETPIETIDAEVRLQDRIVRLDLAHRAVALKGSYGIEGKAFEATLDLDIADLTPYLTLAGAGDLGGHVRGAWRVEGNADRLPAIKAAGGFDALLLTFNDMQILKTENARLDYGGGRLDIPGWDLSLLERGSLHLTAAGRTDGAVDLRLDGNVPLSEAAVFLPDDQSLTGELGLSASVQGTWEDPVIGATLVLKEAGMPVPELDQKLHHVNATVALSPDKLSIVGLKGRLDEGQFDIGGEISLENWLPQRARLSLEATRLTVSLPGVMDVTWNSNLTFEGTAEASALRGEVVVFGGSYYKDVTLNPLQMATAERQRQVTTSRPKLEQPFLKNLALDVKISGRQPFLVENNLADLEIVPDLRLEGTLNQPKATGRTEIREGTIRFRGRRFEVSRGAVDFVNPYELQPELDLRATTDIRRWVVYLDITGPLDNLLFALSSEPSEEPADVLSLILFGRTSYELSASEGGSTNTTSQMLADLANMTIGDDIKAATGIDTIETETVSTPGEDAERTRVTVGKNLSERMTVKYGVETREGETVQQTIAELQLLERLLLSGFQDSLGIWGWALRYRVEFR
jgi:autotransporter translocation and assembly factor TamB